MKKAFFSSILSLVRVTFLPVYENIVKLTSNVWLGILNLKNAKHWEKDKWKINANSVTS